MATTNGTNGTNGTVDPMRPRASTFERISKEPLRMLTKIGGAELTEKLGLRKPAERILHSTGKVATQALNVVTAKKPKERPHRLSKSATPNRFDLRATDDQEMLRSEARRFAENVLRPLAQSADKATKPPAEILARATELALAGLAVPEAFGGIAETSSVVTSTLIIEELARGDMGLALAVLAPLGVVNAIVDYGTHDQQARFLPKFTAGDRFVSAALALLESRPLFDPLKPRTGAVRSATRGGWILHGEKSLVPLASTAETFVVAAEVRGAGDPKLFIVDRNAVGLTIERAPAMGLRAADLGRLHFDGVLCELLGDEEAALRELDFHAIINRARIAWAAMAVGTSQAVLDHVVPYVNERKAFGEPISNRQAVAFMVADLAIEIEGMRLMLRRAAALADTDGKVDLRRYVSMLRTHCAAKAMKVGTDGVQLLGGHGFVKDHPVERWYRDLRAIGVMEGALLA